MSLLRHHQLLMSSSPSGPPTIPDLIALFNPIQWFRLGDNASSSVVINEVSGEDDGTLYSAINSVAAAEKNTNTVTTASIIPGVSDTAFDMGGNSRVAGPGLPFSNANGWTFFCVLVVDGPAVAGNSGVGTVARLTALNPNGGTPEIDVLDMGGSNYRFRVMRSGVSEVAMTSLPTYTYGDTLAIALRKVPAGVTELYVNGSKVAESTLVVNYNVNSLSTCDYGATVFGGSNSRYALNGRMDEIAVFFEGGLSQSECEQLTGAL